MTENKFKIFKDNCMELLNDEIFVNKDKLYFASLYASSWMFGDIIVIYFNGDILEWYVYNGKKEFDESKYSDSGKINAIRENVKIVYSEKESLLFAIVVDNNYDEIYRTKEINILDYNVNINFLDEQNKTLEYKW
jgi:hypothetical protein